MIEITHTMLDDLRTAVSATMSPKRFRHTAAVEEMVARLCALYCPEHTLQLRAAALLHDLTKELTLDAQLELCERYDLPVSEADKLAPKTFHARTAAAKIERETPQFNDPLIVSAVRWHTTGREGMTLTEKLLYLADYIDESRTYPACVLLRRYFFGADPKEMDEEGRLRLLRETMLLSYELTIKDLLQEGNPIAEDTIRARNELLLEASRD
jgi:nicotinate-nucleotide adenylyltransferase